MRTILFAKCTALSKSDQNRSLGFGDETPCPCAAFRGPWHEKSVVGGSASVPYVRRVSENPQMKGDKQDTDRVAGRKCARPAKCLHATIITTKVVFVSARDYVL